MTIVEVCVDSVKGVKVAREGGGDRVELCRELWCGGLTPSLDTIESALECAPRLGLRILVRENPTSFFLTPAQVEEQVELIATIADRFDGSGVPLGFVVGGLAQGDEGPGLMRAPDCGVKQHVRKTSSSIAPLTKPWTTPRA